MSILDVLLFGGSGSGGGGDAYTKAQTDALLAQKQNKLTFDPAPTEGSTNPVTSGGVAAACGELKSAINVMFSEEITTFRDGYYTGAGTIGPQNESKQKYIDPFIVAEGDEIIATLTYSQPRLIWLSYVTYKTDGTFNNRVEVIYNTIKQTYTAKITIPSDISKMAWCFNGYDDFTFSVNRNTSINSMEANLLGKIDDVKNDFNSRIDNNILYYEIMKSGYVTVKSLIHFEEGKVYLFEQVSGKARAYTRATENGSNIDSIFENSVAGYRYMLFKPSAPADYLRLACDQETTFRIAYIDSIYANSVQTAYKRNTDKDDMLCTASRCNKTSEGSKDFCMLEITDSHGDIIASKNSVEIADGFQYIDTLIHCGDFCTTAPAQFNGDMYKRFISCDKPFLFIVGNHDVGNVKTVLTCLTNEETYTTYIKPLVDAGILKNGEYTVNKSYYYHDFDDKKIRIICVYEYDDPNDLDPNDNTKYRIKRGDSVISESQARWFCDTLKNTPSGYSVIVALHQPYSFNANADPNYKFTQAARSGETAVQRLFSTDFWADAVNAYVTRNSAYVCDMVCTGDAAYLNNVETGKYYSFTYDFSAAVGSFMCFIGGHVHSDYVYRHGTYTYQHQVTPVCANTQYDDSKFSDIRRTNTDSPSKDSLTAIGCDISNKKIRLVKIGVNITENMTYRDFEVISVAPN